MIKKIKRWFIRHFSAVYCVDCINCSDKDDTNSARCLESPIKKKNEYLTSKSDSKIMKNKQEYYYCSIEKRGRHCKKYCSICS